MLVRLLFGMLFGVLSALLCSAPAWAATYTFRSDTYSWESTTTAVTWDRTCTQYPGDDDKATINFTGGFTFSFAGTAYSSVRVLSNGMLQFGADTGLFRTFNNTTLPAGSAGTRSGCVAGPTTLTMMAYWADLDPGASAASGGGVFWQQKGTAPNRYVVVSWNSVFQYSTSTPYTFQVILYESGEFKYQYGNANATGARATIGVQVNNTDFTLYAFNSGYNANGSAIRWVVPSTTPERVAEYYLDGYSLNGTLGEVLDNSGNNQHGVRVGSATSAASGYICRGVDIPANTTNTISAIDTLLSVPGTVGSNGSISMWWRSTPAWNNATPSVLFDATLTASRPFYLQRSGGGALRFALADSAGVVLAATTAANAFGATTWVHVTATWRLATGANQSTLRIFVNGALAATTIGTTSGALNAGQGTLFIGDNRSSVTPSGGSLASANGRIDEVRVYNFDQGPADIAADMAINHTCAPPVDHYEISLPSSSLACLGSTVTVTACADSSRPCSNRASGVVGQTATLSTTSATLGNPLLVFDANGQASTTLNFPAAANGSVVSVSLSSESTPATAPRQCCPDGTACSAANSCSTTFRTAGLLIAAAANGTEATLPVQTAGTASATYFLRAVQTGSTTRACEAALTGANSIEWASQCNNPATCSSGNRMTVSGSSSVAVPGNPASSVSAYASVPMVFDSNGNAPFTFNLADVGQVSLFARRSSAGQQSTPLTGRSNVYITRPAGFSVGNIRQTASPNTNNPAAADASGGRFLGAGESFSATITATTASGAAAPNFGRETVPEGVLLTATLVAPAGGASGTLNNATVPGGSFTNGVASTTTLAFSEVGIVRLTPSVADGNYLGAGPVSGSASVNIGRFVPARFALGNTTALHRAALSCSPASSFSYLGENFRLGLTLTAQNSAGGTTVNYAGAFAKLDPTSAAAWNLLGRDGSTVFSTASGRLSLGSASGSWVAGVASDVTLTANAGRASVPDGPFNAAFGIAPVDSDGVAMASFDLASSVAGAADRMAVATLPLHFGRLRLSNAIGPADRPLAVPVAVQHWTGSSFDTQTLDSCTTLPTSTVSYGNLRRGLTAADTAAAGGITLTAGLGTLRLAAPAAGRSGTFDVALSLGNAAADASCMQPWTPAAGDAATTGASLVYLRGAWCSSTHDKDPAARATFGLGRGVDALVYRRENY
jgi:MSHA biogenesis protein MshQ